MKTTPVSLLAAAIVVALPAHCAFASGSSGLDSLTEAHDAEFYISTPSGPTAMNCITDLASNHAVSGNGSRRVYIRHCTSADGATTDSFVVVQDASRAKMKTVGSFADTVPQTGATISDDGNWVAYSAKHLDNGESTIYLAELQDWTDDDFSSAVRSITPVDGALHTGSITISESPFVNADGRFVVFQSSAGTNFVTQGATHIFLFDRNANTLADITQNSDGSSWDPSVSADGTRVAFVSDSTNLVSDDENGWDDVFVWDSRPPLASARILRASQSKLTGRGGPNGPSSEPSISSNGEFVVYSTFATDIAPPLSGAFFVKQNVLLYSVAGAESYLVNSPEVAGCKDTVPIENTSGSWTDCAYNNGPHPSWSPVISADGRYIAFVTELPDLIASWDDGFGEWLPGEARPSGWRPDIQPRVLLRDMSEGRFYLQSARAVHEDAIGRNVPAWYTTSEGYSSCAAMTGKSPIGISLSADGSATVFEVGDDASHCAMQSDSFASFLNPDPHTSWSTFMRNGKGVRSNTDPFP